MIGLRSRPLAGAAALLLVIFAGGCRTDSAPLDDGGRRAEIGRLSDQIADRYPEVPEVDRAALLRLSGPPVLVDVRSAEERAVSGLEGAISVEEYEAGGWEARTVVAYCTVGERSGRFARELRARGGDARNLRGGVLSWAHEGGSVVSADGRPTRRVHVYGPRWDLLPRGWEGVYRD